MKSAFFVLFFGVCLLGIAQKSVNKTIDGHGVSTVFIDGENCFKINLKTAKQPYIDIEAKIEGEHHAEMMLITKQSNDTLFVSTKFQPAFFPDNDKLSAHKLMSVEIALQLPEQLNVYVSSEIAQFTAQGIFNRLTVELQQGFCKLLRFSGNAVVNTVNAPIVVETNFAEIKAYSRRGAVMLAPLLLGVNTVDLKSVNGNITVLKTE